jgi:hypothetical protein
MDSIPIRRKMIDMIKESTGDTPSTRAGKVQIVLYQSPIQKL